MFRARLRTRSTRRRLTLRGISAMAFEDRSSVVNMPKVQGSGSKVWGLGFGDSGLGFRFTAFGFRV